MRQTRQKPFRVAAIQMTSTGNVRQNLQRALRLVEAAAGAGAHVVTLPENFAYLRPEGTRGPFRETIDGELVGTFRERARELGCHLLLGSIPEKIPRSPKIHNTSVLIDPRGEILAVYRKLHLFDARIRGGATFSESRAVAPGKRVVVAETRHGRFGLSVCYDLRFPELYRRMALDGARVLFVPAAFTARTGPHHWLPLLRARAIENLCWVVAPAQWGRHSARRVSHGETAIVDPWGGVRARLERGEGFVLAQIDPELQDRLRRSLPALEHARVELLPPGRSKRAGRL